MQRPIVFIVISMYLFASSAYGNEQDAQIKRLRHIIKKQQNEIKLLKITSGKNVTIKASKNKKGKHYAFPSYQSSNVGEIDPLEITYP